MVKPFIFPRVCGVCEKVKEKKKKTGQFCELKNILRRPTTTTRRKKKKKKKDRKDYSNELNRDVIGIVGEQNCIS